MIEDFNRKHLYFEKIKCEKDLCILFFDGYTYKQTSKESIIDLIKCLKNNLKNFYQLENFIIKDSARRFEEMNRPSTKVKQVVNREGHIYIAKCTNTGFFKIGSTRCKNPMDRIKQLKTTNPCIIEHSIFKTDNISEEFELHRMFSNKRKSGEWFELSDKDLEIISEYYTEYEENGED